MDWTATFDPVWTVSLLPSNATKYMLGQELVDASLVAGDPIGLIAAARRDDEAPVPLLPFLAIERSVDEYSSAWPEAQQRAVIKASFPYHQVKGTRAALVRGIDPLGYNVRVVEWFEVTPQRVPNTFRLRLEVGQDEPWLASYRTGLIRQANAAKNAHTKLDAIEPVRVVGPATVFLGGITTRRRTLRVSTLRPDAVRINGFTFVGAVTRRQRVLRVLSRP